MHLTWSRAGACWERCSDAGRRIGGRRLRNTTKERTMVQQARDVRQDIDQANRRFVEAFNRHDAAGAVAVYTDDAMILPPDNPRVTGRDGIQAYWQGAIDSGVQAVALQTDDLEV